MKWVQRGRILHCYESQNTLPEDARAHPGWSVGALSVGIMPILCAVLYRLALAIFGDLSASFCLALWHVMFPSACAKRFSLLGDSAVTFFVWFTLK